MKSTLLVWNGAVLNFNLTAGVKLGMDLQIGKPDGGTEKGTVTYKDVDEQHAGRHITVYNDANIVVARDSLFALDGVAGDGWILDDGVTSGIIDVFGELRRRGSGEAKVSQPVWVRGIGKLVVNPAGAAPTQLTIASNGNTTTQEQSLLVEAGGTVRLDGQDGASPTATLSVIDDIWFKGGKLYGTGDNILIQAINVKFSHAALLDLRDPNQNDDYNTLHFQILSSTGKVELVSGIWGFDVRGGGPERDAVVVTGGPSTGNLVIQATNTELELQTIGTGVVGDHYDIIEAVFSTISGDFAAATGDFNYSKIPSPVGQVYRATRLA